MRRVVILLPVLTVGIVASALLLSGPLNLRAQGDPVISLDMITAGNTYDDASNSMTLGAVDNCLTATGNNLQHNHGIHVVITNVEDLIGYQLRINYLGDQWRPSTVNHVPFLDSNTGQNISFVNLPIDSGTLVHRGLVTAEAIPPAAAGAQTASFGSTYNGAQNFAISPDSPAKAVPDDTSYSAPTGGVLALLTTQVLAGNAGNPSLFLNLDDQNPNGPGSGIAYFTGTGGQDVLLATDHLGDGYHGEGATCAALDCVTPECPVLSTATPTATPATPTPTVTSTATPTATPTPTPTSAAGTPTRTATPTPTGAGGAATPTRTVTPTPRQLPATGDIDGGDSAAWALLLLTAALAIPASGAAFGLWRLRRR